MNPNIERLKWALALALALMAASPCDVLAQQAKMGETAPAPRGLRFLYLIRHGDYTHEDSLPEETANHLNALGHEQAKFVGKRLKSLPIHIGSLVCSSYSRARETAQDIGKILGMTPVEDSLIHECTASSDRADLMKHPDESAACDSNLVAAWRKYVHPSPEADAYDVLVCHGNVTRWFTCHAIGADVKRWPFMDIANGSITVIVVRPDGTTRLATFSESGHIPIEKQSWTGRGAGWMPKKK